MCRAALVAWLASMATGTALAQGAPAPTGGDSRWLSLARSMLAWFKAGPTPVPIITDNYLIAPEVNVLLGGQFHSATNPNVGFESPAPTVPIATWVSIHRFASRRAPRREA